MLCLPNRSGAALIGPAQLVYSLRAQKHVIPLVQKVGEMEGVRAGKEDRVKCKEGREGMHVRACLCASVLGVRGWCVCVCRGVGVGMGC